MKTLMMSTTLIALAAGGAHAGNLSEPEVTPAPEAVVVPTEPVVLGGDWTGPYGGLSYGRLMAETDNDDEDGQVYGLFGGYDYDFGTFVLGGELDFQATDDYTLDGVDVDSVTRLKLRGGYDLGQALVYATAGVARADTSLDGDVDGGVYGLGLDYRVTERMTVGVEYLNHQFNDVGDTGVDIDANTISLRGAFRF